ncbi:Cyclic nucleotide-gated channel photoreceptor [Oopsacas minuta]|uniref:Cyclic nucleotide-gated channel photoreceptor n=1 Tax=Oopsacas minuta TaxID=111878 RepID=A0AAV7K8D8_9METZ|nr:Cyclic nucleotide-gated channel photoreceptor [Oopsacas minuta]
MAFFENEISVARLDNSNNQPRISYTWASGSESTIDKEDDISKNDHLLLGEEYTKFCSLKSTQSQSSTDDLSRRDSIQAYKRVEWIARPEKKIFSFLVGTTLDPSGTATLYWNALVCMVAAYNLIFIPIRSVFPYFEERYRYYWYFVDYLADLYYVIDIIVQMRTSYLEEGCLEYNWKLIMRHYVKSMEFLIDVIAVLPLEFLLIQSHTLWYHNYIISLRLTRLLKFNKIYEFIIRAESRSDRPNYLRLGRLVLILGTIIHLNACLYFMVSTLYAFNIDGDDEWVFQGINETVRLGNETLLVIFPANTFIDQYFHCLHWSTQMLTTIAEVNSPEKSLQFLYAIALLLFAVLMFATLVGNVGNIIINLNAARTRFESRLDNVKQYMHNRNIKESLQDSVLSWFDHLWEKNRGIDEQETLHNLPNKLRAQIAYNANEKVLINNPIYKLGDEGFKIGLILKLRSELFPPREKIYREGHIGNDMYIIRSGRVLLNKQGNKETTIELEDGDFFGMNCVINFDEFGRERSETATTVGFCDILMLEKKDLMELLVDYPDVKEKLSELFNKVVARNCERAKKDELDIAKATKDMNILIHKYNELKEKHIILVDEHRKLYNAVRMSMKLPTVT